MPAYVFINNEFLLLSDGDDEVKAKNKARMNLSTSQLSNADKIANINRLNSSVGLKLAISIQKASDLIGTILNHGSKHN